jgi:hypothetical protein
MFCPRHRKIIRQFFRAVFVCALVAGLAGCSSASAPRLAKVEFGRSIWGPGQQRAGVLFQDGGQAIPVAGGTLWLFGDTFFGPPPVAAPPRVADAKGAHGTTIAFLKSGETNLPPELDYFADTDGRATNPLSLFPEESSDRFRMWPLGGVSIGARVYLFYSMIEKTDGPAPWNFRDLGGGLSVADGPLQPFQRLRPGGDWKFPVEPIEVLREGGTLYLFEISDQPKGLVLARVAENQIEQPAAYEFFDGGGWTTNRAGVKVILREAYGQVSVIWSPTLGRYLLATSSDFFHPREIQLRTARRLTGPWSAPLRIAVPEMPGQATTLVYGTYLHPELSDESSLRFTFTFCRTLKGEWELSNPEMATVTLDR